MSWGPQASEPSAMVSTSIADRSPLPWSPPVPAGEMVAAFLTVISFGKVFPSLAC